MTTPSDKLRRRHFLQRSAALGLAAGLPSWALAADKTATPPQTSGPFYPVPKIAKQKHHDTDLTRKLGKDQVAKGQKIIVSGQILDLSGKPLKSAVVEVWQACTSGRYNHARDNNQAKLDKDFQYWGRMITKEDGRYEFHTIKPGKYPGRTPHIHFQIVVPGYRKLVTQMYFADESKGNARDGIYRRLKPKERNLLTSEFSKVTGKSGWMKGKFDLLLRKSS